MMFTAAQIAMLIHAKIEGDPEARVGSFSKIEEAKEGQLAFLANPKYEEYLYTTGASVIIVNDTLELKEKVKGTLLRVPDAYTAFASLLAKYQEMVAQQLTGIQQPSYIAATATIGENVFIGAFAYIGENAVIGNGVKIYPNAYIGNNVSIGDNTVIHPSVTIYHQCKVGRKVTIHAGTVIGGDGFGFAPQPDGSFGASALETALAICALINCGYDGVALDAACNYLMQHQQPNGCWPRWCLYYGGPAKKSTFGSEELTTAICLQALTQYVDLRIKKAESNATAGSSVAAAGF